MSSFKGNRRAIRQQFIKVLYDSRYSDPEHIVDVNEVCKKLGIQPTLLEEARFLKATGTDNFIRGGDCVKSITVLAPLEILEKLSETALTLRTTTVGIYRSLLHRYLTNSEEPEYADFWVLEGIRYVKNGNKNIKCAIPKAAWEAMVHRCKRRKLSFAGIVKTLVVNFLEGLYAQDLEIVTKGHFSPNKEDYFLGD